MHRLFELKQAPSDWTFSKVEVQTDADGVAGWQSCTRAACTRIACMGIRSVTGDRLPTGGGVVGDSMMRGSARGRALCLARRASDSWLTPSWLRLGGNSGTMSRSQDASRRGAVLSVGRSLNSTPQVR